MENWVIQELKSLDTGDSRLDKRVKHILNSLSRSPEESIPGVKQRRLIVVFQTIKSLLIKSWPITKKIPLKERNSLKEF